MSVGEWAVVAIVLVGALVFTLLWWKIGDRWADAEHKRFGRAPKAEESERVVIKNRAEVRGEDRAVGGGSAEPGVAERPR